jgi:hypothetical protein
MSAWGRIFAGIYDHVMAKTESAGLGAHRQALLATATGDVLEIGAGTGTNLRYYGDSVQTLTFTEPEKPMVRRLQKRILEHRPYAKLLQAPAAPPRRASSAYARHPTGRAAWADDCRPDQQRGRCRRGSLLGHASESQVRLQVAADLAGSKHMATPANAAKEGSRLGRSQRRTVEGVEMRTFGDKEGAGVRGQHTSRRIKAGPRMGPAPIGWAYPRTRKSRDVSPVSDGIRRPATRRASQLGE